MRREGQDSHWCHGMDGETQINDLNLCDIPLRRKILVADACDKMWPPIGFSAPPATNVMVAPGSATHGVGFSELDEYITIDMDTDTAPD